jgi:glyoxylase-like metal-dependent hydrolase (beta-lactamase superfamily II)
MTGSPAPASVYDVVAVRYGTLQTTRAALYAAYEAYGRPDGPMTMDYYFWVLRTDERTVLVDTGFRPEVGIRRGRTPTCAPEEALHRLGVDPAAVDVVVLTHFHYDHIGNVDLFPGARLVVSRRELDFWRGPLGRQPVPAAPVEAAEVDAVLAAQRAGRLTAVPDEPIDLPGIELVELTGHTPGQLAVRVATSTGSVVLASDAAHSYEEYEQDMPFHVFSDLEGMYRSFETLRTWAGTPGTVVVPGHDPDTMRRFPPAGPGLDGLAVRIA